MSQPQSAERTSPSAARKSLGRQLKKLREAAGKTAADVEEAGVGSRNKLHRIETGRVVIKIPDLRTMCWLYGVDAVTTDQLIERSHQASQESWWEPWADVMGPGLSTYVELESTASTVETYESDLVPGLLQTPAYHRALFAADPLAGRDVERTVQLRVERQRGALERPDPLRVAAVLSEAVLARQVGGPAVMTEQRRHLCELAARQNITIRVLPFTAGAHAALRGPFVVLRFASPDDPPVAYIETRAGGRYIEETSLLQAYRADFRAVHALIIPIEEYL